MSTLGARTAEDLGEWEERSPITLAHWQVRMVLQSLAASYDRYHERRPSDALPAIGSVCRDEVVALLQSTINDIAEQAGLIEGVSVEIVRPLRTTSPFPVAVGGEQP